MGGIWIDRNGGFLSAEHVCSLIMRHLGVCYSVLDLHAAFSVGAIYRTGGIWFQRLN